MKEEEEVEECVEIQLCLLWPKEKALCDPESL